MYVHLKHVALSMSLAFAGAGMAAVAAVPASASQSTQASTKSKIEQPYKTMSDADFAKKAAESDLAQVKMGQLAEDKATSKEVKDLGQRMVDDHTRANDNLKTAAAKNDVTLPNKLDDKDQATYERLAKLSGDEFDRAYSRDLVKYHKADIEMFRHEADRGKDPAIKQFASHTLPTLESHLKQSEQTLQAVSPKTTAKSGKQS
jgi:putative membrane protein